MSDNLNDKHRKATEYEKEQILNMDLNNLRELFASAPIVFDDEIVYAIVNGVAYPLWEIAESTKIDIRSQ